MTLFERIYRHKVIITSALWIIFVLTVVLNMVFNLGIYNYVDSEDVFWNIFRTNGNYEDYEDLQDISMTGETVIQKFYVDRKFNEMGISKELNTADNVNKNAKFLVELIDHNGNVIYSKKDKAENAFSGFSTMQNFFNEDEKNNGIYTLKITPLDIGTASPYLLRAYCMSHDYDYDYKKEVQAEFIVGDKVIEDKLLDCVLTDRDVSTDWIYKRIRNVYAILTPVLALALIIAWSIIKHRLKKRLHSAK